MRQQTLFDSLRGRDGRSLARALIVLVLVSLFAGGLNAGAAAADGRAVICAAVPSPADGGVPGPDGHLLSDCCLAGVMPLGMALATVPPEAPLPRIADATMMPGVPGWALRDATPQRASARGPPLHG